MNRELKIFSGRAHPDLAEDIRQFLNLDRNECKFSTFPDGEIHCKIEDVRGCDVFLIQPTSPPVNDHLMELSPYAPAPKNCSIEYPGILAGGCDDVILRSRDRDRS